MGHLVTLVTTLVTGTLLASCWQPAPLQQRHMQAWLTSQRLLGRSHAPQQQQQQQHLCVPLRLRMVYTSRSKLRAAASKWHPRRRRRNSSSSGNRSSSTWSSHS
jgi:hypothetical protein